LPFGMTHLLAHVTALEREATLLATVGVLLVAVKFVFRLFSTHAGLSDKLQAGRAVPEVTLERAGVAARKDLLARSFAGWLELPTLDRRVQLFNTARAEERLS